MPAITTPVADRLETVIATCGVNLADIETELCKLEMRTNQLRALRQVLLSCEISVPKVERIEPSAVSHVVGSPIDQRRMLPPKQAYFKDDNDEKGEGGKEEINYKTPDHVLESAKAKLDGADPEVIRKNGVGKFADRRLQVLKHIAANGPTRSKELSIFFNIPSGSISVVTDYHWFIKEPDGVHLSNTGFAKVKELQVEAGQGHLED